LGEEKRDGAEGIERRTDSEGEKVTCGAQLQADQIS
jgi:hypothetical protein